MPDSPPRATRRGAAHPHVTVPTATGIGVARNAIIARASLVLVAVGGGTGTTTEMAFGLRFGVPVLALLDAPALGGVHACPDPETAVELVGRVVVGLPIEG